MLPERRSFPIFLHANKTPKKYLPLQATLTERLRLPRPHLPLSDKEKQLVAALQAETKRCNLNNVTRTKAYLDFYRRNPEIHWSFLAHMVSRNTGWNMTDLKGSFLPRLLTNQESEGFYAFLEKGNWIIFADAFPQLLLYEKSKQEQKNYSYLLSSFNVSVFMEVIWSFFLKNSDSQMITLALVVNEQNHLEQTVMKDKQMKKNVFEKIEFKLQDLLSMNQIIFPSVTGKDRLRLRGKTIHQFEELHNRIQIGRDLYAILFEPDQLQMTALWAFDTPHTGSRMDFWPHIFNLVNEEVPGIKRMHSRFKNGSLKQGEPRVYSPIWQNVWKSISHSSTSGNEWFKDTSVLLFLADLEENLDGFVDKDYCRTLEKLEYTVIAKNAATLF